MSQCLVSQCLHSCIKLICFSQDLMLDAATMSVHMVLLQAQALTLCALAIALHSWAVCNSIRLHIDGPHSPFPPLPDELLR